MENSESRNKIQEIAMQIMYGFLIIQQTNQPIHFEDTISEVCEKPYEDCDIFLKDLLIKSLKNEQEIINLLSKFLNKWTFDRLNTCVQAILITAVANYKYCCNTDKAIVINVAIKLAKKYCEKDDYKFVNGILDNCLKDEQPSK
jgi:transcription antitermination factor NusB